jgi:D-sedoheptulose 7-phosphate isomerase
MNTPDDVRSYLEESAAVTARSIEACVDDVLSAAEILTASLHRGGKLLICGNGGSAADAQHLATELVSTLSKDRPRQALAAIALTTDTSILSAIGNDFGFDGVFERQVEALGRPGDVLLAISTSGSSENVVRAADRAKERGMRTIALTGADGGKLGSRTDVVIRVPAEHTSHIQETHLAIEHLLATLVEKALFDDPA